MLLYERLSPETRLKNLALKRPALHLSAVTAEQGDRTMLCPVGRVGLPAEITGQVAKVEMIKHNAPTSVGDLVIWRGFAQPHRPKRDYGSFGPFAFRRTQYEHIVREAVRDAGTDRAF
jgi:hypothetical protein